MLMLVLGIANPTFAVAGQPDAFRREVLAILAESFPERAFKPGADDEEIVDGDQRLYLGNLKATVGALPPDQRRIEIIKWFSIVVRDLGNDKPEHDWAAAQPLLRPRLVPKEYIDAFPTVVRRPFAANLSAASALDLGQRDEYVLADLIKGWGVGEPAVHDRAIANLENMSRDIELMPRKSHDGSGSYVAVQKGDAYDAARILLPVFRGRMLDVLGSPAFAGVPNRDFLVAWSKGFSGQDQFIAQIGKDTRREPYSLSDAIFRIDRDGVRQATPEDLRR